MSERGPEEGRQDYANHMHTSASMDANDRHYASDAHNKYHPQQHLTTPKQSYGYRGMPPAYPPPPHSRRHAPHGSYGYHYNTPQSRGPPQNRLQSVVTTSFSLEDEREDVAGPRGYYTCTNINQHQRPPVAEDRHPSEGAARREQPDEREIAARDSFGSNNREAPPMFDIRAPMNAKHSMPIRVPPSPGDARQEDSPSMSATSPKISPQELKRSFWHHSRPADSGQQSMHPAFCPPKRAKVGSGRKDRDIVMAPRSPGDGGEFSRANSWGGPDDDQHRHYRQTHSFPAPWQQPQQQQQHVRQSSSYGGYPEEDHHYNRSWSIDETAGNRAGAFRSVPSRMPPRPPYNNIAHQGSFSTPRHWASPANSYDWSPSHEQPWQQHQQHQHRDETESRGLRARSYSREMSWDDRDNRQVTFDNGAYRYYEQRNKVTPNGPVDGPPRSNLKSGDSTTDDMLQGEDPLLLLAQPEDRISLSETLCTIRENIEVFMATKVDVEAPAPGRKHPVVVGQVGLRCIHCRHTIKSSDRVKRAVCYPSSIKRIYRTVIDMKLDHFAHCRFVPTALKNRLEELKAINTRSTGTTMQYFVRAANKMGMTDAASGVRLADPEDTESVPSSLERPRQAVIASPEAPNSPASAVDSPMRITSDVSEVSPIAEKSLQRNDSDNSDVSMAVTSETSSAIGEEPTEVFTGKTALALPEDKMALSPLRCFLRENVYAFAASEEDIAVRTPTTFSVVVGQVGIGCVHCHSLPAKERSNRAVCFPFAINRIYQSVADIQRFHLGECKMVPPQVREKFQSLQSASSKGSKGLATRQYWVTSAKKIGLADTTKGIRFGRDPSIPTTQAVSLDILAQVASNVTTVDRPLVLPEDKPVIAGFLYAVMEQLQPCRFTEADRNKRRLKDVGCIGVECKHCAGQVESRKFFWSSVNAVESNFVSVHTHMMECNSITPELKEELSELKLLRKEQTAKLKTGSQKAFFQRVWKRLHGAQQEELKTGAQQEELKTGAAQQEELKTAVAGQEAGNKGDAAVSQANVEKMSADVEKMTVVSV
jgi:hypothetical protein